MQFKNILALSMVAIAATAAPADDLETRQSTQVCTNNAQVKYCCDNWIPFKFLFIQGIGQGCTPRKSAENSMGNSFVGFDLTKSRLRH
jgi:hypothetical protein